jgi:hypothetical protein
VILVLIFSSAIAAPPSKAADPKTETENSSRESAETKMAPSLPEVREAYVKSLQKSARRAKPKLPEVVPALVEVFGQLKAVEGLSHAERSRMRGVVKARLEELRDQLIRELLRNKKLADRKKSGGQRARSSEPVDEKAQMLAGGGTNAQAIQLIDLIQNTIEPDSWQRAGGQGSIYYFAQLQVLVVRQTGEVHHQLGGVLEQLRR